MSTRLGNVPGTVPLLVPTHGPGNRRPRPLEREVTTVGRARGCDLCLEASDVSTIHCVVFRVGTAYHVRDCNSRTGTRVNGEQVREARALHDGDVLQVGPFSFDLSLPRPLFGTEAPVVDSAQLAHYRASRRRLAGHALRLRRLLAQRSGAPDLHGELARVREKTCTLDRRLQEVNDADRELEADREDLRKRTQQVETQLAHRLEDTEQQIRQRWQEFQRRCQTEESQLRAQAEHALITTGAPGAGNPVLAQRERQLAQQLDALRSERQEFESMKQQSENAQADAGAALDKQRATLAHQEAALRGQRAELARMLNELRQLQEELRRPYADQLKSLAADNDELRKAVAEYEARLAAADEEAGSGRDLKEAHAENDMLRMLLQDRERELNGALEQLTAEPPPAAPVESAELEPLRAENELLRQLLAEKDALVAQLRVEAAPKPGKSSSELESYEAELTQERQQMERERARLNAELEQLRIKNQEMDEATRELEMEMSRERAELGRERIRMERLRDELKADMEKLQREMSVRESLAPVHRLREELNQKRPGSKPDAAAERMRQARSGGDTPRP